MCVNVHDNPGYDECCPDALETTPQDEEIPDLDAVPEIGGLV